MTAQILKAKAAAYRMTGTEAEVQAKLAATYKAQLAAFLAAPNGAYAAR